MEWKKTSLAVSFKDFDDRTPSHEVEDLSNQLQQALGSIANDPEAKGNGAIDIAASCVARVETSSNHRLPSNPQRNSRPKSIANHESMCPSALLIPSGDEFYAPKSSSRRNSWAGSVRSINMNPHPDDKNDDGDRGIFRSSTARAVLTISSIALLLTSLISLGANHATNKELSDTVMELTRQLHTLEVENENKIHEIETLEKQVNDKDVELAWESQHVADEGELKETMLHDLMRQIKKDEKIIKENDKHTRDISTASAFAKSQLVKEHAINKNLKAELVNARKQLFGGNRGGEESNDFDRKLRGA